MRRLPLRSPCGRFEPLGSDTRPSATETGATRQNRHMSRERGLLVLLIAACCALAPGVAAAQDIGFEPPTIVDPLRTFGEPDVGVDSQGRVFASGPTGTGTQR